MTPLSSGLHVTEEVQRRGCKQSENEENAHIGRVEGVETEKESARPEKPSPDSTS